MRVSPDNYPPSGFHIKKSTIDRAISFRIASGSFATADLSYASISDERAEPEVWLAHVLTQHTVIDDLSSALQAAQQREGPYRSEELVDYYRRTIVFVDSLIETVRQNQRNLLEKTRSTDEPHHPELCYMNLIRAIDFRNFHGEFATPDLVFAGLKHTDNHISAVDWVKAVFKKYGSRLDEAKIANIVYGVTPTDRHTQRQTEQSYIEFLSLLLEAGIIFDRIPTREKNPELEFSSTLPESIVSMLAPQHLKSQTSGGVAHDLVRR